MPPTRTRWKWRVPVPHTERAPCFPSVRCAGLERVRAPVAGSCRSVCSFSYNFCIVFSEHDKLPTTVEELIQLVADIGDVYEDKLCSRKNDLHPSLW